MCWGHSSPCSSPCHRGFSPGPDCSESIQPGLEPCRDGDPPSASSCCSAAAQGRLGFLGCRLTLCFSSTNTPMSSSSELLSLHFLVESCIWTENLNCLMLQVTNCSVCSSWFICFPPFYLPSIQEQIVKDTVRARRCFEPAKSRTEVFGFSGKQCLWERRWKED